MASQWCEKANLKTCAPFILGDGDEEDPEAAYAAAESLAEVEALYAEELPARKRSKREVVDRILEGDWRHGVSMKQLAMAETRFVLENQTTNRWTALRLAPCLADEEPDENAISKLPRLHAATFLKTLQNEVSPVAKAHYFLHADEDLPLTALRIYLHDTPYNTTTALRTTSTNGRSKRPSTTDAPKSVFVLFPAGTPYLYVSLSASGTHLTDPDSKSLQKFVVEAIPKALSRPGRRYELRPINLSARSLTSLLAHRGAEKSNAAAGGWSIFITDSRGRNALNFAEGDSKTNEPGCEDEGEASSTEKVTTLKRPFSHTDPTSNLSPKSRKRLKALASSRFGDYGLPDDGKNLNSFSVRMTDPFGHRTEARKAADNELFVEQGNSSRFKPDVRLTFHGAHVFAGLRALVERGVIDGKRMPGWLTGEAGVNVGVGY